MALLQYAAFENIFCMRPILGAFFQPTNIGLIKLAQRLSVRFEMVYQVQIVGTGWNARRQTDKAAELHKHVISDGSPY